MPTEEMTYRQSVLEKLDTIQKQVAYTNGKVKKITGALLLLAGVVIGMNFSNPKDLISLVAGLLH